MTTTYTFEGFQRADAPGGGDVLTEVAVRFTAPDGFGSIVHVRDGSSDGLPLSFIVFADDDGDRRFLGDGRDEVAIGIGRDVFDVGQGSLAVVEITEGALAGVVGIMLVEEGARGRAVDTFIQLGGPRDIDAGDARDLFADGPDALGLSTPGAPFDPGTLIQLADAPGVAVANAPGGGGRSRGEVQRGSADDDVLKGGGDDDRLIGRGGDDRLVGRGGDDALKGGGGEDRLLGGGGDDRLGGGGGDDLILGGGGQDRLLGGGGDDALIGGRGSDVYKGGAGVDTLAFRTGSGTDVVRGFRDGEDVFAFTRGVSGFDDLTITQQGRNVMIDYGRPADMIIVQRTDAEDIDAFDFLF